MSRKEICQDRTHRQQEYRLRRVMLVLAVALIVVIPQGATAQSQPTPPDILLIKDAQLVKTETVTVDANTKIVRKTYRTRDGRVGIAEEGVTTAAITKLACKDVNFTATSSGADIEAGACLETDGSKLRNKSRLTCWYPNIGDDPCLMNVGWDQSPPAYRRVYYNPGSGDTYAGFSTAQRGPCLSCHTTVAYSTWACPSPVRLTYVAKSGDTYIRHSGLLTLIQAWNSDYWTGCSP